MYIFTTLNLQHDSMIIQMFYIICGTESKYCMGVWCGGLNGRQVCVATSLEMVLLSCPPAASVH